jgi:phasin family protein
MATDANPAVETVADTAETKADIAVPAEKPAVSETVSVAKPARKAAAKVRRKGKPAKKPLTSARKRNNDMKTETNNLFANFGAFPGVQSFEKLFADASARSEQAVKRSRKAAEDMADLYRRNVDAFVEAGKIAATGAQSIGQDLVAKGRDSMEQTANTVRTFAEAKSPTELLQLQSDFARTAFDRFVEESSAITESVVKLAGEAFQPLSNRASANVERFNEIAA